MRLKQKLPIWHKCLLLVVIIILFVFLIVGFYQSNNLIVTHYRLESNAFSQPLTIVHLSDLHCCEYGSDNELLLREISAAKPDMVVMTGDMISRDSLETDVAHVLEFVTTLSQTLPVFYSLGNHELDYVRTHGDTYLSLLVNAGATVLERQYQQIEIKNQSICIGGIYGYILSPNQLNAVDLEFMQDFTNKECPSILLCHMPESLLDYESINYWDVDIVFSGHTHGGQVRLPLVGGLYDPETGWFPQYERGMFQRNGSTVIVSSGLGSSKKIPRFGNPPELVVVFVEPTVTDTQLGDTPI